MRLLKIMLPLMALLLWSVMATADYNPTSPPEPGVDFTLTARCVPENSSYNASSSNGIYPFGSEIWLTAGANYGYRFVHWEDETGNVLSTEPAFTYTMPARDVVLTARFVYDPDSPQEPDTPEFRDISKIEFQINPPQAGYFIYDYNQEYEVGSEQYFYVYEHTNYRFVNWTRNGEVVGTSRDLYYTVPYGDHVLVANFEYTPDSPEEPGEQHFMRQLTLQTNPENAATLYGGGEYLDGSVAYIYANSNRYYTFINWTDEEGTVVSETESFNYEMPNRKVTLTANYTYEYDPDSPGEPGVPNPDGSIGENMVAWPRFGMFDQSHVMILCETEGATIHYTLDESDPTEASPVYTEPVFVGSNLLVKAIAYKDGMEHSPIRSYRVSSYVAGTPVYTFENRKIKISSSTPDAVIRYTLDFSEPTAESDVYTTPFEPEENCRIKAYASKEGLTDSPVSIYVYRRAEHTIEAPKFEINDEEKLVIIPAVEGGITYYTTDGSEPTAESTVYTGPITLTENGIVKAFTTHINYFDSPTGEFIVDWFAVQRPTYEFLNPYLTFATATPGAEIRYTMDGAIPTPENALYTEPLHLTEDCRVIARAFKENNEPSDTVSFTYVYKEYQLPTPTAEFAAKKLTLLCADTEAQIRFTVDGSAPTASSELYEAPLALTEDCTVRFFAMRDHFNNSEEATFVFVKADYQVEAPVIMYDPEEGVVTMTTATENAEIRYTTDGTTPEEATGLLYEGPITVEGNTLFLARAFRSDLFASEQTRYAVSDQKVPTPEATYGARTLTLRCDDPQAAIHFTTDGSEATAASSLYTAPIALNSDLLVRFIATRDGFEDSDENQYRFELAEWQESPVYIDKDFRNRRIFIYHPDSLQAQLTIHGIGVVDTIETPIDFHVLPEMTAIEVTVLATDPDRYDSEPVIEELIFHRPPQIVYDGHSAYFQIAEDEPYPNESERWAYFNGNLRAYGYGEPRVDVLEFGYAHGHTESDYAFCSDEVVMEVEYFNTGRNAGAINGHHIEEAFGTWGDRPEDYEYLRIVGEVDSSDLRFAASLANLRTLHLDPYSSADNDSYDSIFAGTGIETISTNFLPEGMLKGMPRLTTVLWGLENVKMPDGRLSEAGNPNLLLWLTDAENAPDDAVNVVLHDYIGEGYSTDPEGSGITGTAENVRLVAGYPFNAHMPVEVAEITFEKEFNLPTEIDVCQGWESIVLPFEPEYIVSERVGELQPFATWDGSDYSAKPFWLYRATPDDWLHSDRIEAGVPYIISMPNNEEVYIPGYSITGKVIFISNGCTLGTEETLPVVTDWVRDFTFEGSYMPVEASKGLLALNSRESLDGKRRPGSVFAADITPLPFESFVRTGSTQREMPVFGDWSGVLLPTVGVDGLLIETPAPGVIRISSERQADVTIHTLTGALVRRLDIAAGDSATVSGLAKGIYLVAGRKIMVR